MPFVSESLVVEQDGKLVALVYPDYEALDRFEMSVPDMESSLDKMRDELNKLVMSGYQRLFSCRMNLRRHRNAPSSVSSIQPNNPHKA